MDIDLNSFSLQNVILILVCFGTVLFSAIRYLIKYSSDKTIEAEREKANTIKVTMDSLIKDFSHQIENLRGEIRSGFELAKSQRDGLGGNIRNLKDIQHTFSEKIEKKLDETRSGYDILKGKVDFIEKHADNIEKKIDDRVKILLLNPKV